MFAPRDPDSGMHHLWAEEETSQLLEVREDLGLPHFLGVEALLVEEGDCELCRVRKSGVGMVKKCVTVMGLR
jgi:hypothetical protein